MAGRLDHETPTARNTAFGWVLLGPPADDTHALIVTHLTSIQPDASTGDDNLKQFWEIEEQFVESINLTFEERMTLDHFNASYTRDGSG